MLVPVGISLILAFISFSGFEFSFYNHFNPLYSPYFGLFLALILYAARSRIRIIKEIWNTYFRFNSAGIGQAYELNGDDIKPIYFTYLDNDGKRHEVKHTHPFVIPSPDGFEQIYMGPISGLEALNPEKVVKKWAPKATKEQITALLYEYKKIVPDIEIALDPEVLVKEMTEQEDADTIFQEFKEHVADISAWSKAKDFFRSNWATLILVGVAGFSIATSIYMIAGVDFRQVLNR